jgi:hypothetical protein
MLTLDAMICRLGKISNNLECHGSEYVSEFNIPVTGIMLDAEQLNVLMQDPHCDRSLYNARGALKEPMPWLARCDSRLKLCASLEADYCCIRVSGSRDIEFEVKREKGGKGKQEDPLPACKISKMTLEPRTGGLTELSFQLQVRPGIGKNNLLLQEHQHREVKLTVTNSKVVVVSEKQQPLGLGAPAEGGESAATDGEKANGGKPTTDDFEAGARAQVAAFKRGRKPGEKPQEH